MARKKKTEAEKKADAEKKKLAAEKKAKEKLEKDKKKYEQMDILKDFMKSIVGCVLKQNEKLSSYHTQRENITSQIRSQEEIIRNFVDCFGELLIKQVGKDNSIDIAKRYPEIFTKKVSQIFYENSSYDVEDFFDEMYYYIDSEDDVHEDDDNMDGYY